MRKKPEGLLFFLAFIAIASVYFFRMFAEGAVPVFGDGLSQLYPMRLYQKGAGLVPPLWNPYEFAGVPFIGLMQTAALYPPNIILYYLLPAPLAFNASFLLHYGLAGLFTYLYLREIGIGRTPAFFGASAFAFSGFVMSTKQHVAILNASVWLPLVVYFAERFRKTLSPRHAASAALAIAMQLLAGNFQICLYTYVVLAAYFVFSLPSVEKGRRLRFGLLGAAAVALGIFIALPQIAATLQMSGLSLRPVVRETLGEVFAGEFYVYLMTLPSLVFPHLYSRAEFGTLLPVPNDRMIAYTGILPLAVAVAVVLKGFKSSRTIRLWAVVGLLGIVLASADDTPLGKLLFRLPVYGMFHAHGRNLLEFSLAVSVLFAVGMDRVISDARFVMASLKALAGVAALGLLGLALTWVFGNQEAREAISPANPAVFVPLLLMALYALGLVLYGKNRTGRILCALLVVVLAEAYVFGAYHEAGWTPAAELSGRCQEKGYAFIKGEAGEAPPRVAVADTKTRDQFNVPCGVGVLNSYDQLISADYATLFGLEPFGYSCYWDTLLMNNSLLSMAGVKYLAVPEPSEPALDIIRTSAEKVSPEPVAAWQGPFYLPQPDNRTKNRMVLTTQVLRGIYAFSARASARDAGTASLRMEIYNREQAGLRDGSLPFNLYPGLVDARGRTFYRLFRSEEPQFVRLSFAVPKYDSVELSDVALQRLEGYGPPPIATSGPVYEKIREAGDYGIYLNRNALPRAYSVTGLVGAGDIHDVKMLFDFNLVNPSREAVLYEKDLNEIGAARFSRADVSVVEYDIERVALRTSSQGRSFIVLADQYYPGWRAAVDGKETRIYKTNGVLRGVVVPAGEHEVVFEYAPLWLVASIFAGALLAAALLVYVLVPLCARPGEE